MYLIKSNPGLRIYQAWGLLIYISGDLHHLINALIDNADICIKKITSYV